MSDINKKIRKIREDFNKYHLSFDNLPSNPINLFKQWIEEALEKYNEANAFTLSTVSDDGIPNSRILLLRELNKGNFIFFTNYKSSKANDINNNNNVALNFYWSQLQRQVRIIGTAAKISSSESDKYFKTRPRDSQIGAWVSDQSSILDNYHNFIDSIDNIKEKFKGKDIERPLHWGGYSVTPLVFEFWQGRPSRLHDRFRYTLDTDSWKIKRLAP